MTVIEQIAFDWPPAEIVPHPLAPLPRATKSHGEQHARLIADVVRRERAWTVQFRKQAAKLMPTLYGFIQDCDEDDIDVPRVVPDAYRIERIDRDNGPWAVLTIWEVEVRNHMPTWKLDAYAGWWFDLDATDWYIDFKLVTVDEHGVHRPVDLCAHWYANRERICGVPLC